MGRAAGRWSQHLNMYRFVTALHACSIVCACDLNAADNSLKIYLAFQT